MSKLNEFGAQLFAADVLQSSAIEAGLLKRPSFVKQLHRLSERFEAAIHSGNLNDHMLQDTLIAAIQHSFKRTGVLGYIQFYQFMRQQIPSSATTFFGIEKLSGITWRLVIANRNEEGIWTDMALPIRFDIPGTESIVEID